MEETMTDRGLSKLTSKILVGSLKGIREEIADEHVEMVRDLVKGAYRMRHDLEKNIQTIQTVIKKVDEVLDRVEKQGDIDAIKELKIDARYLDERTARLAGLDWTKGIEIEV
jgi:hypothetical protein